jgi:hypothetical protein
MSDGYYKRNHTRLYDSPNVASNLPRYKPLSSDLEAMQRFEQKQIADALQLQEHLNALHERRMRDGHKMEISHTHNEMTARRDLDKSKNRVEDEQVARSTYSASYTPYYYEQVRQCPPNEFYKKLEYANNANNVETTKPSDLIELQDGWSKSLASKRFHSAYHTRTDDLRQNVRTGKKKVENNPVCGNY